MVISNAGSIVLALPINVGDLDSPTVITAQQVRILSFANTVSRLLSGSVADWMSPIGRRSQEDLEESGVKRRKFTSRVAFLACFTILLSSTFAYGAVGMRTRGQMWPLRCD
jgi:hypothetical protein